MEETAIITQQKHVLHCTVILNEPRLVHLSEAISHVDKELLAEHVEDTENHRMLRRSHLPVDVLSETYTVSSDINHNFPLIIETSLLARQGETCLNLISAISYSKSPLLHRGISISIYAQHVTQTYIITYYDWWS